MTKDIVNLNNVNGPQPVSAVAFGGGTVTIDVPVGPTYQAIFINGNAGTGKLMTDLIGEIRIKINGKVQRVRTAQRINQMNELHGSQYAAVNGATAALAFSLPIFFAEPWRKNINAQEGLAWGTGDVSTFQIEVDLKASTFTSPVSITAQAMIDDGPARALGIITKWFEYNIPTASGWNDFTQLPRTSGAYAQLTIIDPNLSEYEFKTSNKVRRQATAARHNNYLAYLDMYPAPVAAGNVVARTGFYDIVFDLDDIPGNALPMNDPATGKPWRDVNLRINTASVGTVPALLEVQGFAE